MMTTPIFSQTPPIETGVPQTLAKWRGANYSDVRYKLNLTLEKMSPTLKGTIEISLKNNADQIVLDWRKIRGKEDLSTVSNISINGKAAKFEEINEHLVFKDGVIRGENIIKLDFTSPIATSGAAITCYVDKEDSAEYIYSLFVPSDASTAFPVFDQPDLKARFSLELLVPLTWRAVSNSEITSSVQVSPFGKTGSFSRFIFAETKPISTYVFAFAAGDFAEFSKSAITTGNLRTYDTSPKDNELTSSIYVRKSQIEKFKSHQAEVVRLNREGVKFLESYFDYKFPFPKYDLVLIPEFPFGGMEHAGATFLRESSIIFPQEPTKNDYVSRANLIFHEAAHQWFGDTVTMKWFDDLWLKEGFAEFMAYKTLEKVMPEYNAWKIFYERNKQLAYLTDSTKGTTPIYQEIPNLSSAKSAYGNIVYRKAPSFLKQAEFYLGADKFQTAVRAFLKKHQFANAEWTDLVKEFELASGQDLKDWANVWVTKRGMPFVKVLPYEGLFDNALDLNTTLTAFSIEDGIGKSAVFGQHNIVNEGGYWKQNVKVLRVLENGEKQEAISTLSKLESSGQKLSLTTVKPASKTEPQIVITMEQILQWRKEAEEKRKIKVLYVFPNYQDYGYGIFLLDEKSRDYVLENIQNEKDDFLRTMMWGSLWDSVRETELAPKDYVELVIKNINVETDESTIQTLLNRVSTAMNYYLNDAQRNEFVPKIEAILIDKMQNAPTLGQRITFYRAFLNVASSEKARQVLKEILNGKFQIADFKLKTKDKFDTLTRLLILGDKDAPQLLAELEKTETSDDAKRYAYAAKAGIATAENKAKFWNDFVGNKEISESWIESAFVPFNSSKHAELTLPFLEKALAELPNLKRNRKIFFVNGWLGAFIGGQRSEQALAIVNKFLADNPNLDRDLRLKILENADGLERAVKIRAKFAQ
jgi:aminopeptidase N